MEEEEEKPAITRRFFKIMLPGFHEKLNLPQDVCKNLSDHKSFPDQAILETRLGKWRIRVCRNREGLIWFQNGWPDFIHRHHLNLGDIVVFQPTGTGTFHFNALVFDINGCEKKLPPQNPTKNEKKKEKVSASHETKNPFLTIKMKPYHGSRKSKVAIPQWFIRANKIEDQARMVLRAGRGREWKVDTMRQRSGSYRAGAGWHDFYEANNLKLGDVCVFYVNSVTRDGSGDKCHVVLDVRIFPVS